MAGNRTRVSQSLKGVCLFTCFLERRVERNRFFPLAFSRPFSWASPWERLGTADAGAWQPGSHTVEERRFVCHIISEE